MIEGQVGWVFQQAGVVEGVPAHGRSLEQDELQGSVQPSSF